MACLLARTWSGPEAIAIWVELVAERKRDINENTDASQIQGLAARVAAQQEISRADLASWDASARAWLLSADETQKFRLTQLRLIIKDSGLLVSSFGNTHDSVIDVWTTAMKTLQDLILGRPQRISKGALLIGLSCWHIFPDLNVVDPLTHVKFNDELIAKGGVVTLGLKSASPDNDPGVQWSLSLSHLRYYGNPVIVTSHTSALGSRISMENLHMVVLGAVFGTWGQCFTDAYAGAQLISTFRSCLDFSDDELEHSFPGMHLLWSTARRFLTCCCETERRSLLCLISYGRRRGQNFLLEPSDTPKSAIGLAASDKPRPAFGLAVVDTLWNIVSNTERGRVSTRAQEVENLRKFAKLCDFGSNYGIIRYPPSGCTSDLTYKPKYYAYTTAIPHLKYSQKRNLAGHHKSSQSHAHWVARSSSSALNSLETLEVSCQPGHVIPCTPASEKGELPDDMHRNPCVLHFKWTDPPEQFHYKYDEESGDEEPGDIEPSVNTPSDEGRNSVNFYRSFGYNNGAYLFHAGNRRETRDLYDWEIQKILELYVPNLARSTSFSEQLRDPLDLPTSSDEEKHNSRKSLRRALSRLVQAAKIYRRFPGATVPISIVDSRINDASCFEDLNSTLASKFACIAMFETGNYSIQSTQLKSVMAMSSGNAIYVADALIQDPIEPNSYGPQGITRIIGNIDHPGVVMLAPPQAPLIRTENADSWRVIDHHKFDGKLENCFSGTSLRLSFTKYEIPLSVSVGAVDADISMVETLISAHDQKNWVADLDVLSSLRCEDFFKRLRPPYCKHANQNPRPPSENAAVQIGKVCSKQLVSIASWEELLDPPGDLGGSTIAVVRAYDNWPARVATMSVCVQMGLSTRVLPTEPLCTVCGNKAIVDIAIGAQVLIF